MRRFSEATLGKAPIDTPRRAMGDLLGHAVRFGVAGQVMAAGEGIETMLSLWSALPTMPMVAALSAAHLSAILFHDTLRRLYIARDDDPAGDGTMATLIDRASRTGTGAPTQRAADPPSRDDTVAATFSSALRRLPGCRR
jgi:hypothetical protein